VRKSPIKKQGGKVMKCSLCERFGAGLVLENGQGVCFICIKEIKKFGVFAPNPFQEGLN